MRILSDETAPSELCPQAITLIVDKRECIELRNVFDSLEFGGSIWLSNGLRICLEKNSQ